MSKQDKSVDAQKHNREGLEKGDAQKGASPPGAKARAWGTVQQLPSAGKKMVARRKLPSGPLGGSGRKTNVSRSS